MTDAPHWTEPGAHPVADGVHRIPLPLPMDGLRAVNVYAIETEEGLTLVDGGWAIEESRTQLDESLASIGRRLSDITRFLVTHVHRDHYTQAVTVRREFGSHVSLGLGEQADARRDPRAALDSRPDRRRRSAAPAPSRSRDGWQEAMPRRTSRTSTLWEYPDTWLDGDHRLAVGTRTLDAVSTPGHTQGHFVFADLDGRAAVRRRPRAADHHPVDRVRAGVRRPAARRLPRLARQGPRDAGPAAAARPRRRCTGSTHARVDELVAHHDERLALCLASRARPAGSTAYDVAGDLPWTRHERHLDDLDVFNAGARLDGDDGAPRAAGRAGRGHPRATTTACNVYAPTPTPAP